MNRIYEQLRDFLMGLDPQQRFNLGFMVVAVFAGLIGVYTWSSHTPYRTVLSNRDPSEVMEAVAALGNADVQVVQQADGSIAVPVVEHSRALAVISEARIYPSLGDIVDVGAGVTNEQLYQGLLRQLRGDLARVIEEMDGVSRASVMVDVPRRSHRLLAPDTGSASVWLAPHPGQRISDGVIEAAAHLVSGSVEGLRPDRVTVTDNSGMRWGGAMDDGNMSVAEMQERQGALESALVEKAERLLEPVLGDRALYAVTASVTLTTVSEEIREETFDPEAGAAVKTTAFETESQSSRPGGVPGADAALPERAEDPAQDQENRSESREEKLMQYPRTTTVRVRPAGEVVRQTVSVLVDQATLQERTEAAGMTVEQALSDIEAALRGGVGLDASRGDELKVAATLMAPKVVPEAPDASILASLAPYVPYVLQLLAMGLVFVLLRPLIANITKPRVIIKEVRADGEEASPDLARRLKGMVDEFETVDSSQLNNLINQESEASAQVLRLWSKNG